MQFNTLTLTLQNFITAFSAGYGHLQGPIRTLLGILVGIEILLLGLWTALGGGDNVSEVFEKILQIGAWIWVVQSFPTLAKAFVESLVQAGLLAGGGTSDVSLILDPSRLAGYGLDATQPLAQKLEDLGTFDIPDLLVFGLGYLAIMACFVLMAINIFLAVLEYYLFVACVGILLPFGVFGPTRFLAERAIGAVIAAGIKLMVLSFITAVLDPVLRAIHFQGPVIALNELWAMLLTLCAMTALCWKAPSLAASLLASAPHLGGAEVVMAGTAGALAGRNVATAVVGGAGASAALRATQAAVALASAGAAWGDARASTGSRGGAGADTPTGSGSASQSTSPPGAASTSVGADPSLVASSSPTAANSETAAPTLLFPPPKT